MIPCALEFRNRSHRPAWICKQMHPQLMTLFYNCALKIASRKVFLKYNREELADYLGTTRPSVSREINKMKKEGLIDVRGRIVYLLNGEIADE